jgi:polygalacturonase
MMFDGLNAESCRQVRLSRSRPSYEDDIVCIVDELAAMKLA